MRAAAGHQSAMFSSARNGIWMQHGGDDYAMHGIGTLPYCDVYAAVQINRLRERYCSTIANLKLPRKPP
jgi:hypothetical protein